MSSNDTIDQKKDELLASTDLVATTNLPQHYDQQNNNNNNNNNSTMIVGTNNKNDHWYSKRITTEQIVDYVPNGSTVYIGSTAATPELSLQALVDNWKANDIQILQMLPGGILPHLNENIDRFRTMSFFSYRRTMYYTNSNNNSNSSTTATPNTDPKRNTSSTTTNGCPISSNVKEMLSDYKPMSLSSIQRLLDERIITVDVAIIKITPPHKGFCSLGFGVDSTIDVIKYAKTVIAEVTTNLPWTEGLSKVPISCITHWIQIEGVPPPLKTTAQLWPGVNLNPLPKPISDAIGCHVANQIPDGATLKFDWNPSLYSITPFLYNHKNLGLHSDVLVDNLYQLQLRGVINNTQKSINRGTTVVSQAHGNSEEFYDFLDRNPAIEFHSSGSYVNNPLVLSQIDNLIVLIAALKIDITGQVTTDSIGHKFYGGVWSTADSIMGARLANNGKSIVILPSISSQGRSNIVFALPPGTGISITRSDIEYVITEYGTAYLYGKSILERCLALIEIAHPDFRTELFMLAKQHHYISQSQPGKSFRSVYPDYWECYYTTKRTRRNVFVRPIKAADEDMLRTFFHKLSDHSVYLRYFRRLRSLSQQILQKYTDIDYTYDIALIALYPKQSHNSSNGDETQLLIHNNDNNVGRDSFSQQYEIVGIVQLLSDYHDGIPEIAFQVRDDWQGEGIGKYLFQRLVQITISFFGYTQLKADVLYENTPMRHLFETSNIPFTTKSDFGVLTYIFDLPKSTIITAIPKDEEIVEEKDSRSDPKK